MPSEEPAYSRAYAMDAGTRKASAVPQSEPHKDKHGKGVRKGEYDERHHEHRQEPHDDLFFVIGTRIFPPRILPVKSMTATAEKKNPGICYA